MKRLLSSMLLGLAVLTGCQSTLQSGTVMDRTFEGGHYELREDSGPGFGCGYGFDLKFKCGVVLINLTAPKKEVWVADKYYLKIGDGVSRYNYLSVSKEVYDKYSPGEHYP